MQQVRREQESQAESSTRITFCFRSDGWLPLFTLYETIPAALVPRLCAVTCNVTLLTTIMAHDAAPVLLAFL